MSIRVVDLEKKHPGASAPSLAGLCMEVPRGAVASVLGRSGAGKTTLLRCLSGLDPFDRGSVEIDGVAVGPGGDAAARQRSLSALRGRVGLVFQAFELFPHLSVLDNCTLAPQKVKLLAGAEAERRALGLLEALGVADKAKLFPEALSGGQKQRVAIARALAMEPAVLLYDEPTSALDPSLKQEVGRTLRRVSSTGVTQILVTHDLSVARDASDLVFVLDAGRVVEQGPPAEVFGSPRHPATAALLRGE